MSLVPLTITHAGGTRSFDLYQVAPRSRSYAVQFEVVKELPRRARVIGDRLENPSTVDVSVYIQESSLASSYALAYVVIDECESASLVKTHEGDTVVDGIVAANVSPDGLGVRLVLSFAPTTGGYL